MTIYLIFTNEFKEMSNPSLCKSECKYMPLNRHKVKDLHMHVRNQNHITSKTESIKYAERQFGPYDITLYFSMILHVNTKAYFNKIYAMFSSLNSLFII